MRLIEPTQKPAQKDRFTKYTDQLKQILPFGKTDLQDEGAILAHFERGLDNRFIMLHNLQLEGSEAVSPPIIIGPTGVIVLNVSHAKGFFRAKEESWWEMNKSTNRLGPAKLNLIKQSQEYAQNLAEILDTHGKSHPAITPVLICADPGAQVETYNSAIRIVMMDGVDNFISSMMNGKDELQPNEINYLSDSLEIMASPEKAIPIGEGEDFFGRDLFIPEKKASPKLPSLSLPTNLPPVEEQFHFSQKQWMILAILVILTIIILLIGIIYALRTVQI